MHRYVEASSLICYSHDQGGGGDTQKIDTNIFDLQPGAVAIFDSTTTSGVLFFGEGGQKKIYIRLASKLNQIEVIWDAKNHNSGGTTIRRGEKGLFGGLKVDELGITLDKKIIDFPFYMAFSVTHRADGMVEISSLVDSPLTYRLEESDAVTETYGPEYDYPGEYIFNMKVGDSLLITHYVEDKPFQVRVYAELDRNRGIYKVESRTMTEKQVEGILQEMITVPSHDESFTLTLINGRILVSVLKPDVRIIYKNDN